MAKMRTRRRSLSKAALEAVDRCAQALDFGGEALELAAPDERPTLRRGIVGERLADATRRVQLPAGECADGAADALRGRIAEHARELLFDVPAQVLREIAQLIGEFAAAGNPLQR